MDVAALSQNQFEAPERGRSVVFAEPQLFTQLLDQHLASQQNTANNTDSGEQFEDRNTDDDAAHRDEDGRDDTPEENHVHHRNEQVAETVGIAFVPSVVELAPGKISLNTPGQPSLTPTTPNQAAPQVATAGTGQVDQPRLPAGQSMFQVGQPNSKTQTAAADSQPLANNAPDRPQQNLQTGALLSAETNPDLKSQIPATVSANATFVQEQAGEETSLRAGRDEAIARHALHSGGPQIQPDQPKPAGIGNTQQEPGVPADRPSSGQVTSMLQATAVKPTPIMVATPMASQQPTATRFAAGDPTGQDFSFERGLAPHLSAAAKAKTGPASPTTTARAATPPAQQVAMQIRQAVGAGADHIRIQLQPAELGKVDVRMTIVEQTIHAVVTVDRPEALEQLQRDSRGLLQALEDAGLRTDSDSLTFRHREPGGHSFGNNEAGGDPAHAGSTGHEAETDQAAGDHGRRQAPRHDGLISIEA